MKAKKKAPDIILKDGKPAEVILDIEEYREMLERLDDMEDLTALEKMRKRPLEFKKLDDFLNEYTPGV
jgi:PHD/YefM family antitoxin component YafN of YafNO toxin-antitoxin module